MWIEILPNVFFKHKIWPLHSVKCRCVRYIFTFFVPFDPCIKTLCGITVCVKAAAEVLSLVTLSNTALFQSEYVTFTSCRILHQKGRLQAHIHSAMPVLHRIVCQPDNWGSGRTACSESYHWTIRSVVGSKKQGQRTRWSQVIANVRLCRRDCNFHCVRLCCYAGHCKDCF